MGTSTSNKGQKGSTPLVPSWLNEGDANPQQNDPKRFSEPRGNFTRFINNSRASGGNGSSGNLHKATSYYVQHSLGGSHTATMRLGSARNSTARLVSVFNGLVKHGVSDTQRLFHLGDMIGKKVSEALLLIADFVCPDGGLTDEGIARDAYIEAIVSLPELENKTIEELTPAEFLAFTEIYMAKVIEERLVNDIGNKIFFLPDSVNQIDDLQKQLNGYIKGAVSDAVSRLNVYITEIDSSQAMIVVDSIYQKSYEILAGLEG